MLGKKCSLNIIPNPDNNGSGDVNVGFGSHSYNRNEVVTLTAIPKLGSGFLSWAGDWSNNKDDSPDLAYQPTLVVQMNSSKTIEVNFLLSYKLTLQINLYGVNPIPPTMTITVTGIGGDGPKQGFTGVVASNETHDYFVGQDVTITTGSGGEGPSHADALGGQSAPTYGTRFEGWSGNILGDSQNATYLYSADPSSVHSSQNNYMSQTITIHMRADTAMTANWYTYDSNAPVP